MFRTVSLSIIRSLALYTQQYIQVMLTACQQAVSITYITYTYCCVYSARLLMMDRETVQNMQSSIPPQKLEKLVHLVGFIIKIAFHISTLLCAHSLTGYYKNRIPYINTALCPFTDRFSRNLAQILSHYRKPQFDTSKISYRPQYLYGGHVNFCGGATPVIFIIGF